MLLSEAKEILKNNGYRLMENTSEVTDEKREQIYNTCKKWLSNGDDAEIRIAELDRVFDRCLEIVDPSSDVYESADSITRMIIENIDEEVPYPWSNEH